MSKKQVWGPPSEVNAAEMRGGGCRRDSPKWEFVQDVMRRLEQTGNGHALRYPFSDLETARKYAMYAAATTRVLHGIGYLRTRTRDDGEGPAVYVRRGPNYPKVR